MSTLIERLKSEIERQETRLGSEHPFVKQLKEQLRASIANEGKSTQDVYRMQARQWTKNES
jgi:hypothetical protein